MIFPTKAVVFTMLAIVMGLRNPSHAFAQTLTRFSLDAPPEVAKKSQRIDFIYHASEAYLAAGTSFDMMTTANGLGHPTTAWTNNGVFLTHYYVQEDGWARIAGRRDATGVVLANVILNVGIDLLDRKLYRRGGKWRTVAVGLNVLKGTGSFAAGINNVHTLNGIDKVVQMQTGYRGAVVWSR